MGEAAIPPRQGGPDDSSASLAPLASDLLRRLRSDPAHLPEELAVFSVREVGPRAAAAVSRLRTEHPRADARELAAAAISRGVRTAVTEGAFVGGPFLLLVPVAFCAALLAQIQLVLEIAALSGLSPQDPARAAELLVLQGAYADIDTAAKALRSRRVTGAPPHAAPHAAGDGDTAGASPPAGLRALWSLSLRMAALLGLTSSTGREQARTSRPRRAAQWLLLFLVFLVGLVAPLVWLPYMGVAYRTGTRRIAERASHTYLGHDERPPPAVTRRLAPGMAAAALRALLSILMAAGLVALVLGIDVRLAGSTWPALCLVLISGAAATGALWWRGHHRRRRRT